VSIFALLAQNISN